MKRGIRIWSLGRVVQIDIFGITFIGKPPIMELTGNAGGRRKVQVNYSIGNCNFIDKKSVDAMLVKYQAHGLTLKGRLKLCYAIFRNKPIK